MPTLHLAADATTLHIDLDGLCATAALPAALTGDPAAAFRDDPLGYGRQLFDGVFGTHDVGRRLLELPAGTPLRLVLDSPALARIPWEGLRGADGELLAARLAFVRGLPATEISSAEPAGGAGRWERAVQAGSELAIIGVPVSPVDEPRGLNTEQEWERLVQAVAEQERQVALKRVRPPTLSRLEQMLPAGAPAIVQFMGHSASHNGQSVLVFEDERGAAFLVSGRKFADALDAGVLLVILNSCHSALAVETTEFANLAAALAQRGVPYALGMQFVLPDDAALELTRVLYSHLLQGRSVEEAVRRVRRHLADQTLLGEMRHWAAAAPVLYTARPAAAEPASLAALLRRGRASIAPDPERLAAQVDLSQLPAASHFTGRSREMAQVLRALADPTEDAFVVVQGLGGMGKTVLARRAAERVLWRFDDRVLAISFERFAAIENGAVVVNGQFTERFLAQLAQFYGIDTRQAGDNNSLAHAILQERRRVRSLLILDNLETLLDALRRGEAAAQWLGGFVRQLREGRGGLLITTRIALPAGWGQVLPIELEGLDDDAGAELWLRLLPPHRQVAAPLPERQLLARRLGGHPLALRLLAGRFAASGSDLGGFAADLEPQLRRAEQSAPASLEDPGRQATLYACMAYSIDRLDDELRHTLGQLAVFRGAFAAAFAAAVLRPEADAEAVFAEEEEDGSGAAIDALAQLGLLVRSTRSFATGSLLLFELHPMLRWYVSERLPAPAAATEERYAVLCASLVEQAIEPAGLYDHDPRFRFVVQAGHADFDAALVYLPGPMRSAHAYRLANLYARSGRPQSALSRYEEALESYQELGDWRGVSVTQSSMADVLMQMGKPQEAMKLYEESLRTKQELGDRRGVSVTQSSMAAVLRQMGKPQEAMKLYEESLRTKQELSDRRGVSVTQSSMADVLRQMGKPQEAMKLYEESLRTCQELGDRHGVSVTQSSMADVLRQMGKPQEAMKLYEESLRTKQELGDRRGVAVTQSSMADVLRQMGKPQEAMKLYEESLRTFQELGDRRGVSVTQSSMADVLRQMGKPQEAMKLYEESLRTFQELGDRRGVSVTQSSMADVLRQMGKPQEAMKLYEESLRTKQELGDRRGVSVTQSSMADVLMQMGKPQEAMKLYEESLRTKQELGDRRGVSVTQHAMAAVLRQMGKPQEAMKLYEESLRTCQELGDRREIAVTQSSMADVLRQMGKPQEAMKLYEESLRTKQELGDRREIAVTQSSMADVLRQMGKPQEAMKLYEESLRTFQELGDRRGVSVTQSSMADVLRQMGKPQEAIKLYEESLRTKQELGDRREVAVTQANLGQMLLQEGDELRGLALLWDACRTLEEAGYTADLATMQELLVTVKVQFLGAERFDQVWPAATGSARQPAWLAQAKAPAGQGGFSPREAQVLVANTVAVMTSVPARRLEWRQAIEEIAGQAQAAGDAGGLALSSAILRLLDGQAADLPADNPHSPLWQAIEAGIAAGGLPHPEAGGDADETDVMPAIQAFVGADGWAATRQVVEQAFDLLSLPQVEAIFAQNIRQAQDAGEASWAAELQTHLDLLRRCKRDGIGAAFAALEQQAEAELPFDPQLLTRTAAALKGSAQDRLGLVQHLVQLAAQPGDPALAAFYQALQMVLMGADLEETGRPLAGIYAAAWQALLHAVRGDGLNELLGPLINNTYAVLTEAREQAGEWQTALTGLHNQAVVNGDSQLAALAEALLGLLQSGGQPGNRGANLTGPYAAAWQALVEALGEERRE